MPADEVTHGADVDESRARTGPRHAARRKPLFTRFHMPAGKAIASVAMPTAVIVGMGFTSSLALADTDHTSHTSASSSETISPDDYKKCVEALEKAKDADKSSPSPSASASASDEAEDKEAKDGTPSPSATPDAQKQQQKKTDKAAPGASSSPDSGSGDKGTSGGAATTAPAKPGGTATTPSPSATPTKHGGGLLGAIGDTLDDLFHGGSHGNGAAPSASTGPSASATGPVKDTAGKVKDTVKGAAGTASKAAGDVTGTVKDTTKAAGDAAKDATDAATGSPSPGASTSPSTSPSPSPSASAGVDPKDCPAATDAQGGVDNKVPLADDPWYLDASSLTLNGASYKGVVQVRTADGSVKKVLKYVISAGTDIVDLHQTVKDKDAGKTYHVQSAKGEKSTITGGDTVMYTESISGNLLGLLPVTFSPSSPPPLDIPWIYFTKAHVVQAAQFGGNLHIPGMRIYTTDGV
ncbi:hypothetical protein ABZ858_16705 [Streptomyces sp. NPDC047017]|uniref:hypothetical protein n=1 Tax=Streptomyces sp. NPDC047017 TaxID=3155024 RepID=UPI0033CD077F